MASDRFPSIRTSGEGYETEGREYYDHKISITYDYSDVEVNSRLARKAMSDFSYELYNAMKGIKSSKDGFIFADSTLPSIATIDGALQKTIQVYADDKQIGDDMIKIAKYTSAESKDTIKKYIGGRVQTGTMKRSVYGRIKKRKGSVTAEAGWLDLWYKYFAFQEEGTSQVRPMHAIMRTYLEIGPWIQKGIAKYLRSYTRGEGLKG